MAVGARNSFFRFHSVASCRKFALNFKFLCGSGPFCLYESKFLKVEDFVLWEKIRLVFVGLVEINEWRKLLIQYCK